MIDKKSQTSYELVYDMLTGIKNAVVETFAKRATRHVIYIVENSMCYFVCIVDIEVHDV